MAENLPPLVIQATTNDDWGITLGRHIPFKDYCLRCRFKPDDGNVNTLCSQGDIDIPQKENESQNKRVHASLPFLSASAAALIVSEMCKLSYENYSGLSNYVAANLKFDLSNILTLTKSLNNHVLCVVFNQDQCGKSGIVIQNILFCVTKFISIRANREHNYN